MLEIYLEGELLHQELSTFFEWLEFLQLPFEVNKAPNKPIKILSSYVEASHKQTGIWYLPLKEGHLRILLSKSKHVGPQSGECVGQKMMAVSEDISTLKYLAMHEIGHALTAVDKKRDVVLKLTSKPEFTKSALNEKAGLIKRLSEIHPDGIIDVNGLHCLHTGCIMQATIPTELLAKRVVTDLFCDDCLARLYKNRDDLLEKADSMETCQFCVDLHECMYKHCDIWEDALACKNITPVLPTKEAE